MKVQQRVRPGAPVRCLRGRSRSDGFLNPGRQFSVRIRGVAAYDHVEFGLPPGDGLVEADLRPRNTAPEAPEANSASWMVGSAIAPASGVGVLDIHAFYHTVSGSSLRTSGRLLPLP